MKADSVNESKSVPKKRPFGVTLLLWLVLSLSVWGSLRLSGALRGWEVLNQFHARLGPLYLSITGVVWALAGAVLLWSIWTGKRWALPAIPISICIWLAEYWIERIFFQSPRANAPFMIAVSVFLVAVTCISAFHRKSRNFLMKSEAHEQPEDSIPE